MSEEKEKTEKQHFQRKRNRFVKEPVKRELKYDVEGSSSEPNQQSIRSSRIQSVGGFFTDRPSSTLSPTFQQNLKKIITTNKNDFPGLLKDKILRQEIKKEEKKVTKLRTDQKMPQQTDIELYLMALNNILSVSQEVIGSFSKEEKPKPTVRLNQEKEMTKQLAVIDENIANNNFGVVKTTIQGLLKRFGKDQFLQNKIGYLTYIQLITEELERKISMVKQVGDFLQKISVIDVSSQQNVIQSSTTLKSLKRDLTVALNKQNKKVEPNVQTLTVLSQFDRAASLISSFVQPKIEKKGIRREVSMSKQTELKGVGSNEGLQQANKYLKELFEKSSEDKDVLLKQLQNLKRNKKKSMETPYNLLIRLYDQINGNKKQINEVNLYLKNISQIFTRKNLNAQNLNLQIKKSEEKFTTNQTISVLKANLQGLISSVQEREKFNKQTNLFEQQVKKLKSQNQKLIKINEDLKGKVVEKIAEDQKVDKRKQLEERRLKEAERVKTQKFQKQLQKNFDNIFTNLNQKKWKIAKNSINIFVKKYQQGSNQILSRSIQSMNTINNLLSEVQSHQNQISQLQKREKVAMRDYEKQKEGLLQKIKGLQEYQLFLKDLLSNINQDKYPLKKVFDDLKKDRKKIVQQRYLLLDKLQEPLILWRSRKLNQNFTFQLSMDSVGPQTSKSKKQKNQLQIKYKQLEGKAGQMSKDVDELLSLIKRIQRGGEWWKFIPKNIKNNATFKPVYTILQQYRKYQLNIQALKTNSNLIKQEDKSMVDAIALSLNIVEKQNDCFSEDLWEKKLITFKAKEGGENLIKLLKTFSEKSNSKIFEESQRLKLEIERLQRSLNDRDKSISQSRQEQSSSKKSADMRSSRRSSRSRDNKQGKSKQLIESYIQDQRNYLDKIEEIKQQKLKMHQENQSLQLKVKAIEQQLIKAEQKCFILEETKAQLEKEKYQQFGEVSHLRGELEIAEGRILQIQTKMESQINEYKDLYNEVSRKIVQQGKKNKQILNQNLQLKTTIQRIKIKQIQTEGSPNRVGSSIQNQHSSNENQLFKFKFNMESQKVVDFFEIPSSVRRRPKNDDKVEKKAEKEETVQVEVDPLEQKIQFLTNKLIIQSNRYQQLSSQNNKLGLQNNDLKNELTVLREKIRVLSLQNNNLMINNSNLSSEVNGLQQKNQILSDESTRLGMLNMQLTNELTYLRQKIKFLTEENNRISPSVDINNELTNLRERFRIITLENTRLNSLVTDLTKGLNNYRQNIEYFTSQNNRLLLMITDLTTENNSLKIKIQNILSSSNANDHLLKDIEELRRQNSLLKQQLIRFKALKQQEIMSAVQQAVQKQIDGFNIFLAKDQAEREKHFMQVVLPKYLQQQRLKSKVGSPVSSRIDINSSQFLTLYNQKLSIELDGKMQIFITNFMQKELPKILDSKKSQWMTQYRNNFYFDREMWQLIKLDEWTARQIVIVDYWHNILLKKEKEWYDKYHSMKKETTIVYQTHPDDREMWQLTKAQEWTAREMAITEYWSTIMQKKEREWYDRFNTLKKEPTIIYKTNPDDRQMWELTKAEQWTARQMAITEYWSSIMQKKEREWYDRFHSLKKDQTIVHVNQWNQDDRLMWQLIKADEWTAREIVITEYWQGILLKKEKEWYDKYHSMKKETTIIYQSNPKDRQMWESARAEEWSARETTIKNYWNGILEKKQKQWSDKLNSLKKDPAVIYQTHPDDRQMWQLTKAQEWAAREMTIIDYWSSLLQKKEKQWYDRYFLLKNQKSEHTIQTNDFDRIMWQLIKADEWTARQMVLAEYWNNIMLMKEKEWYDKYHLLKKSVSHGTKPVPGFDRITWQTIRADEWKARELEIQGFWNGVLSKKEKQWFQKVQMLQKQLNNNRQTTKTGTNFTDIEMLELLRKEEYRQVVNVIINDAWTEWALKQQSELRQLQKEIQNYYETVVIPKIVADLQQQKKKEVEAFQLAKGTEAAIEQWKTMFLGAIIEQERHSAINFFVENQLPNIISTQYRKWVADNALQMEQQKKELIQRELSNLNTKMKEEMDKLQISFTSKLSEKEIFYQSQIIQWQQKAFHQQARAEEFEKTLKLQRQNWQIQRTRGNITVNQSAQVKYESQIAVYQRESENYKKTIAFLEDQLNDLKAKCSFYEKREFQINKKIQELQGNYILKMQAQIESTLATKLTTFQNNINAKSQAQLVRRLQQQKKIIRHQLQIQIRQQEFINIKHQIEVDLRSQLEVLIRKEVEQDWLLRLNSERLMWEKAKIDQINAIVNGEYHKWETEKQNEIKVILLENDKKWEHNNLILLQNERRSHTKTLQAELTSKKIPDQEYKKKLQQQIVVRVQSERLIWSKQKQVEWKNLISLERSNWQKIKTQQIERLHKQFQIKWEENIVRMSQVEIQKTHSQPQQSVIVERLGLLQRQYNEKIIPEILQVEYMKWVNDSNHALELEKERWMNQSNKTLLLQKQKWVDQQKKFIQAERVKLMNENNSKIQIERKRWLSQLPQLLATQQYRIYIDNYLKTSSIQNEEKNRGLLAKINTLQARAKQFQSHYSNSQTRNKQLFAQITQFQFKLGEAIKLREAAQLSSNMLRNELSAIRQQSNDKLVKSKTPSRQLQELKKIIENQAEQLKGYQNLMRENSRLKQQILGVREENVNLENNKWREIGEIRDKYQVKILQLTNERTNLLARVTEIQTVKIDYNQRELILSLERQIATLLATVKTKDTEITFLKRAIDNHKDQLKEARDQYALVSEQRSQLQRQIGELKNARLQGEYELKYLQEREQSLRKKLELKEQEVLNFRKKGDSEGDLIQKKTKANLETIASYQIKYAEIESLLSLKTQQCQSMLIDIDRLRYDIQRSEASVHSANLQIQSLKMHLKDSDSQLSQTRSQRERISEELGRTKLTLNQCLSREEELNKQIQSQLRASKIFEGERFRLEGELQKLSEQVVRVGREVAEAERNARREADRSLQLQRQLREAKSARPVVDAGQIQVLSKINHEVSELTATNRQLSMKVVLLENRDKVMSFSPQVLTFFLQLQRHTDLLMDYLLREGIIPNLQCYHRFLAESRPLLAAGQVQIYFAKWQLLLHQLFQVSLWSRGEEMRAQAQELLRLKEQMNEVLQRQIEASETDNGQLVQDYKAVLVDIKSLVREFIQTGDREYVNLLCQSLGVAQK